MIQMSNYWSDRLRTQMDILYDKTSQEVQEQLANYYKAQLQESLKDISDLYDKLLKDSEGETVKPNDLYKYNRYFEVRNRLNQHLTLLGGKEIELDKKEFIDMYKKVQNIIKDTVPFDKGSIFVLEQEAGAKKVLESIWCADGKHWSNRVWDNKSRLQQLVEKGLLDSVSRGTSKDELVKTVMKIFGNGFYESDRLVRTELTHIQNQAAMDRYKQAGVKKFKFLAEIDGRTSNICKEMDGKIFSFEEAKTGENVPPLHPFCRSTIIPVIE